MQDDLVEEAEILLLQVVPLIPAHQSPRTCAEVWFCVSVILSPVSVNAAGGEKCEHVSPAIPDGSVAKIAVGNSGRCAVLSGDVTIFVKEAARDTKQRSGFFGGQHLRGRESGQI